MFIGTELLFDSDRAVAKSLQAQPGAGGCEMELKGNISDVGLPVVMQTIIMGQMTGTLHLKRDREEGTIFFREGKIIFASSSAKTVRLGEILRNQGKITQKDIDEVLERQKQGGGKFGQLLVDSARITQEEIAKCLSYQAEEIIFSILAWKDGSFIFIRDILPDDLLALLTEETSSLISEGKDKIEELLLIRETIPSINLVLELKLATDRRDVERDIDLTLDEWQILSLIDGNRTVAQICGLSPANTFTTCRIISNLIHFDIITPQTVRLFLDEQEDPARLLLKMTTMMTIYNRALSSVYEQLVPEVGDETLHIMRENIKTVKDKFPQLFSGIELNASGTFDQIHLMQNLLALPMEQQLHSLRNGLNSLMLATAISLKDHLGKKKFFRVVREISDDITALFELENTIRQELKNNLETVISHTSHIPSSFKIGLKLLEEGNFTDAYAQFKKIPETNPNYKKAQRYLEIIRQEHPELSEGAAAKQAEESEQARLPDIGGDQSVIVAGISDPEPARRLQGRSKIVQDLLKGLKLYSLDKYPEAIELLDRVLLVDPLNPKATKFRAMSIEKLADRLADTLGPMNSIPIINSDIGEEKLATLTLSPHEGYLLSRVNGSYSLQEILGISGLDRYNTLKIFDFFLREKLVILRRPQVAPLPSVVPDIAAEEDSLDDGYQKHMEMVGVSSATSSPRELSRPAVQSASETTGKGHRIDRSRLAEQHYKRGMTSLQSGEFAHSVEEFEAAILNNPNNPVYYNLLDEARAKKRHTESGNHFEEALVEIQQKNWSKAVRLLKRAITNSPRNAQYYSVLGDVLTRVPGKREEALFYYKKAIDLQPNSVELILKIGKIYRELGQKDLAMKAFRSCLASDASNPEALMELRRLQLTSGR